MSEWFYIPQNLLGLIVVLVMAFSMYLLYRWQRQADDFDLRDALTAPGTDGIRRVDTSKTLLVGTFLVSSYLLIENYSDTALGVYLGAWVINGGAVLAYKAYKSNESQDQSLIK